jgi:hypothetical protein
MQITFAIRPPDVTAEAIKMAPENDEWIAIGSMSKEISLDGNDCTIDQDVHMPRDGESNAVLLRSAELMKNHLLIKATQSLRPETGL